MKAVLGVKLGPQHDTGACIVREGPDPASGGETRLLCWALSEERLSRRKNSREFPRRSIDACLHAAGLEPGDIDLVVIDKLGPRTFTLDTRPVGDLDPAIFVPDEADMFRRFDRAEAVLVNHHLGHAASAFHVADLPDAAVLVVDGHGTWFPLAGGSERLVDIGPLEADRNHRLRVAPDRRAETQSIFAARGRDIRRIATSTRAGVGLFYTYVTKQICNFKHLQEGKTMGLAAWGSPDGARRFPAFPDDIFRGVDTLMMDWLTEHAATFRMRADEPATHPAFADAAWWAQSVLERAMLHLADTARTTTGSRNLCMAGGVALNIESNRTIRDRAPGEVFVQPAASDAGMPLGAALYGYYNILRGEHRFQANKVYLGPAPDETAAEALLVSHGGHVSDDVTAEVARHFARGRIIGWWQGRSEYGPRALGARSILCSPRPPHMKDHLNSNVKHREAFRPFAPICPVEHAPTYFDVGYPSPFMLFNTRVRKPYQHMFPAITHADGTARLQTIARADQPRLHDLLIRFGQVDGHPVLLNTSFNDAGEPIVESAEDALRCFANVGIDTLVCGRAILNKEDLRNGPHP